MNFTFCGKNITDCQSVDVFIDENGTELRESEKDLFFRASEYRRTDIMTHLVKKYNWNCFTRGIEKDTPFTWAAYNDNLKVLNFYKDMYDSGESKLDHVDKYGNNALLAAANNGNVYAFEYLLDNFDFDIYSKNYDGSDAYILAACHGCIHFMKYLEDKHNWNVKTVCKYGDTAYYYAVYHGCLNVMKYLDEKPDCNFLNQVIIDIAEKRKFINPRVYQYIDQKRAEVKMCEDVSDAVSKKIEKMKNDIDDNLKAIEKLKESLEMKKKKFDNFKSSLRELI